MRRVARVATFFSLANHRVVPFGFICADRKLSLRCCVAVAYDPPGQLGALTSRDNRFPFFS
jgi:hypothetical protein